MTAIMLSCQRSNWLCLYIETENNTSNGPWSAFSSMQAGAGHGPERTGNVSENENDDATGNTDTQGRKEYYKGNTEKEIF